MESRGTSGHSRRKGAQPRPCLATAATFPVPATPLLIPVSALVMILAALVAIAARSPLLALPLTLAALVPFHRSERQRGLGRAVAFLGVGWALFGLALSTGAVEIGNAYGSPPFVFALGFAAFVFRVTVLHTESVIRWTSPRWAVGTTAKQQSTAAAMSHALRALDDRQGEDVIDGAVVALSLAGEGAIPEDERERRAFFIDVYNILARHAGRGRVSPRAFAVLEALRTRYHVAAVMLSLDDIEHGILRGNAKHPVWRSRPFAAGDRRRLFCVSLDSRIHFALHCGAASAPSVRSYRGSHLDDALDQATRSYLQHTASIDDRLRVMRIPALLVRYEEDFGGPAGIRRFVEKHLGRAPGSLEGYRMETVPFDWSSVLAEPAPA